MQLKNIHAGDLARHICASPTKVKESEWRIPCPNHRGEDHNCALTDYQGRVTVKCYSGNCEPRAIWKSIEALLPDLFEEWKPATTDPKWEWPPKTQEPLPPTDCPKCGNPIEVLSTTYHLLKCSCGADYHTLLNAVVAKAGRVTHYMPYPAEASGGAPAADIGVWRSDPGWLFPKGDSRKTPRERGKGRIKGIWMSEAPSGGGDCLYVAEGEKSALAMLSYLWATGATGTVATYGGTGSAWKCALPTLPDFIKEIRILPDADVQGEDAAQLMADRWTDAGFDTDTVRLTQHVEYVPKGYDAADLDQGALTDHLIRLKAPCLPMPPHLLDMSRLFAECATDLGWDNDTQEWMVWNVTHWTAEAWTMKPSYLLLHEFRLWLSKRSLDVLARCDRLTAKSKTGNDPDEVAKARDKWQSFSKHLWSDYWPQGKTERMIQGGAREALTGPRYGNLPTTLINLTSGLLDLNQRRLRPHAELKDGPNRPIATIDLQLSAALASGKEWGPEYYFWMGMLDSLLDDGTTRYLQMMLGAALGGGIRRRYLWLYGPPSTGKSTFLNVLHTVLGPLYGVLEKSDVERNRGQAANHNGSLKDAIRSQWRILQYPAEAEKLRIDIPKLKMLTGGDYLRVRGSGDAHGQHVEGAAVGMPILLSNSLPKLEMDSALTERQQIIPFTQRQAQGHDWRVNVLDPKLQDAGFRSTVLAWMIRGYYEFRQQGDPLPSEAMNKASVQARQEQDPIGYWLDNDGQQYQGMTSKELTEMANLQLEGEITSELTPNMLGRHLKRCGWVQQQSGKNRSRIWNPA